MHSLGFQAQYKGRLFALGVLLSATFVACESSKQYFVPSVFASVPIPYETRFLATENPISESNKWINGQSIGLDWANVQTKDGLAFSTESGKGEYRDATAILAGVWKPDQAAQAVVHTVHQDSKLFEEVELRLRTVVSPHRITGYEVNFRCTADGSQYVQIVRWNGPLGKFSYIANGKGPGLRDGDIVKATIVGSRIVAYINGRQVVEGKDDTFKSGSPGVGFYNQGGTTENDKDFGFSSFRAEEIVD